MRTEILPYIIMAAEQNSITRAAEEAHMSQTTLSAAIRAVEKELGITFFSRTSKGVILTEDGLRFVELARKMLDCYHCMEELSDKNSYLTIYVNTVLHQRFMDEIYGSISRHGVSVNTWRFRAGTYFAHDYVAEIHHQAVLDLCDIQFWDETLHDLERRGFEVVPLMKNHLVFYLNRDDPLSARPALSAEDVAESSIVLSKYSLWCLRHQEAMRLLKRGRVVDGSVNLIFDTLADTGNIAFLMDPSTLPKDAMRYKDRIAAVPWEEPAEEGDEPFRQTFIQYMYYHKDARFSHVERDILREITRMLSEGK